MSAKEEDRGFASVRTERSTSTAGQSSGHTGTCHTGSERRQQQASSSSHQGPLHYSGADIPASYQRLFGGDGLYDADHEGTDQHTDQSTDKDGNADKDAVLPDSYPAAYTLRWGPQQPCVRTPLDIDNVVASSVAASSSGVAGKSSSHVNFLRRAWQCDHKVKASGSSSFLRDLAPPHKLFVIRDTGDEDTNRLICAALDVDPDFMASHISGQRYRPRDRPWRGGMGSNGTFSACSYAYPQTLTLTVTKPLPEGSPRGTGSESRLDGAATATQTPRTQDGGENLTKVLSAPVATAEAKALIVDPSAAMSSNPVVVFCRGSVWFSPRANVLILDRNPSSTSLEDALMEALDDTEAHESEAGQDGGGPQGSQVADILPNVLSGLIYDQWLDFVDSLSASNRVTNHGKINRKLVWGMSQYLEQNLTMALMCEKKLRTGMQQRLRQLEEATAPLSTNRVGGFFYDDQQFASSDEWKELLSRLERIVTLLPLQARNPIIPLTVRNDARFMASNTSYTVNRVLSRGAEEVSVRGVPEIGHGDEITGPKGPVGGINEPPRIPYGRTPQGQVALNRISYMGGILLPFSVIAGVLSMSDPFGPGDHLFWVFWVITLPITLLTVSIIYADNIRRNSVWIPMNHRGLQRAINKGEAVTTEAATRLARAAERVADRFSSADDDMEMIEMNTVASAVRLVDSRGSDRRRAKVRVFTGSGPDAPAFYRLPETSKPASPVATPVSAPIPAPFSEQLESPDKPNVHIPVAIHRAHARRRLGILGQLRRVLPWGGSYDSASSSSSHTGQGPIAGDVECGLPSAGETIVIDVAQPNVDSGTAEMFSRPVSGLNVAAPGCPAILVEQRDDGGVPKAWRLQELGWIGAYKQILGYQKPRDA